ncbi:sensor histidine kinase [Brachybacterium paraconglomeratum]|uniref:sensor histidine kinase n=1 Tax=Brachybacterium paraconglomeratum TaxID=173362 RepID=UPI003FD1C11D
MPWLRTEGWAGAVMLVVAVGVSLPALLGAIESALPRPVWFLLLVAYLLGFGAMGVVGRPWWERALLAVAVLCSWALILSTAGGGLIQVLVVLTAAASVYIVPAPATAVIILLNTGVVAASVQLAHGDAIETLILSSFYLLIQVASAFSTATLLREVRMRTELARAHVELRAAAVLLEQSARTAERLRISRELHDLIGHQLTVLTLSLEAARHLEGEESARQVERADRVARELLGDVRATVGEMRERSTELGAALRGMVEGLPGLDVVIETDPGLRLGESEQIALIRLAQETVTNTLRHAEATRLRIEVSAQDGDIVLLARDDGAGAGELALGNGLRGLRERFEQLGGEITIDPGPGFMVRGRLAGS